MMTSKIDIRIENKKNNVEKKHKKRKGNNKNKWNGESSTARCTFFKMCL